uniref:NADH-ubiquinone oxidoreductase chain 3 n=1 Tax=Euciroa cf. queenslandica STW-2017 TaxID=1969321 RepID=A0A1U9XPF4_9BIVA|nr:NADH dehydrogenase subunit 3 [Euciroa cf. queenslandica STW-2017]AQZ26128.1 NADH dehydrogenase subunit 3 [Euciroa cf. queenslandica STW-2017]
MAHSTTLFIACIVTLMLSMAMMCMGSFLSYISKVDAEKSSPYECGFDPMSTSRFPFSVQFFLVAVIFLIFDVEVVMLLPLLESYIFNTNSIVLGSAIIFLSVLLLGLYHEWHEGALEWV